MRGQKDGGAEVAEATDDIPELAARLRVKACRGLVEEDELGAANQCDANVETSHLATREAAGALVGLLLEADELDHLVDGVGVGKVGGEETQRLVDGQCSKRPALLQDDAEFGAPGGSGGGGVFTEHGDVAAIAGAVALKDLGRRRLASAILAEECEDLALLHLEVEAIDDGMVAVALNEAGDGDGGGHALHPTAASEGVARQDPSNGVRHRAVFAASSRESCAS